MVKQIGFVILLFFSSVAFAQLTTEQESAKKKGLELYNQYMGVSAVDPLRIAAEAGDKTAQYYLGGNTWTPCCEGIAGEPMSMAVSQK